MPARLRSFWVMLNYPPHSSSVCLNPATARVQDVISAVEAWLGGEALRDTITLRWIVNEHSAFPESLCSNANAITNWYKEKGQHLKSEPIRDAKDLRSKLQYITKSKPGLVQLYVIGLPKEFFGMNHLENGELAYLNKLNGGLGWDLPVRTTSFNPTPSSAGKERNVHEYAQLRVPMHDGRHPLADNLGPNVAIYVQAFAEMWHTLNDDQKLSQVVVDDGVGAIVEEFCMDLAAHSVKTEDDYLSVVAKHLPRLLPSNLRFHKKYPVRRPDKQDAELDFVITCVTPYDVEIAVVVGETKHREGNGGSGPSQALYGFRRLFLTPNKRPIFFSTCCPCLIVAATGYLLHVDRAMFTDRVYSTEMLVMSLSAKRGATEEMKMKRVRSFQVLKNAIQTVAQFYEENHMGVRDGAQHLLPAPCVLLEASGPCIPFQRDDFTLKFNDSVFTTEGRAIYRGEIITVTPGPSVPLPLDDDDSTPSTSPPSTSPLLTSSALYEFSSASSSLRDSRSPSPPLHVVSSTITSVQPVYIKFVDSYGKEVHEFLAQRGYAPLIRCIEDVVGGAIMVVMDRVSGRTVQDYLLHKDKSFDPPKDLKALDEALALLHENGFVHGDLRPPNVVLHPNPDGTKTAFLIDFDWARKHGEARYPKEPLNNKVTWPLPVDEMCGALIEYSHDIEMRRNLPVQPSGRPSHLESARMPPPIFFERASRSLSSLSLKRPLSQMEDDGATTWSSTQPQDSSGPNPIRRRGDTSSGSTRA